MACDNLQMVLTFSELTPDVGEVASCTARVTNTGTTTETYHVVFTADGNWIGQSGVITLDPGNIHGTTINFAGDTAGNLNVCADLICDTAPTITLVSPLGGESWVRGTSHTITWSYTGDTGNVSLYLYLNHGWNRNIVQNISVGSGGVGSYTWTVPTVVTAGTTYTIAIENVVDVIHGESAYFTIA